MPIDHQALSDLALTVGEYEAIVERLGREPNALELGLFGSLWSEHCGYQHTKPLLAMFASAESERLLVAPGSENAGAVDIGGGWAIVMKIESHNHPSAVEPYEGAATGVGGIVRDIFAMGARPIALLNSLRFGPLSDPRSRYLFEGVVAGISGYGNCIGVPDVGGEVHFSQSYSGNPLVNAMCVGLLRREDLRRATAGEPGSLFMLVGSDTGRDGIHGASGLASRAFEDERELRPTVQVGNPFMEKILIEACLEAAESDAVIGIQDLGAAGLTSAAVETARAAGVGVEIDVARVPRRESGMEPYEVMLSESQERMLIIVRPGREAEVRAVFERWDLRADVIGKATDDGIARVLDGGEVAGEAPVALLTDPPLYRPPSAESPRIAALRAADLSALPLPAAPPARTLLDLLASPNITSREWIYRQYDHQVQTNTVIPPGADAALLRIRGTDKGIALSVDGNGRLCYLDPYIGGMIAVAEACRNISCVGAAPIALTDCLNFGNPERPEIYWQLERAVSGMADAARRFAAPVISGNASLYNETRGEGIYPTPIVGALGLTEDVRAHATPAFRDAGDIVILIGRDTLAAPASDLAGSEYLETAFGKVEGAPSIDLDLEIAVQRTCRALIAGGIAKSAHDCSDGGIAVALSECCVSGAIGATITAPLTGDSATGRLDAALFGEGQSRIIISVAPADLPKAIAVCQSESVPHIQIGTVGGDALSIADALTVAVDDLEKAHKSGLGTAD